MKNSEKFFGLAYKILLYFVRRVLEEKEKGNLIGNIRISDKSIDYHVRETEETIDIIIETLYDVY